MTREAPPTGFDTVAFERIDANTERLGGFRATASLSFEGVFARTPRTTNALSEAEIFDNPVTNARRVIASLANNLTPDIPSLNYEAVRLGEDVFLVRDGVCVQNAPDDAKLAVELSAGTLLGGIKNATTAYQRATVNSEIVWRYAFIPDDLVLPNVGFGADSQILGMTGELWVSPTLNAVVRYYLTLEVENITLFGGNLPVSGTLFLRYELYEAGTPVNLSVPFGC